MTKLGFKIPCYKDSSASPERRVKDLLARLTLAGKAAQMMCFCAGASRAGCECGTQL